MRCSTSAGSTATASSSPRRSASAGASISPARATGSLALGRADVPGVERALAAERSSARRGVVDEKLHALPALPAVGAEMAGDMESRPPAVEQRGRRARRRARGTRSPSAAPAPAPSARMRRRCAVPTTSARSTRICGMHEARLGIAGAERADALDQIGEVRGRRRRAERAVDRRAPAPARRRPAPRRARASRNSRSVEQPLRRDGEARRHRVAAAIQQQPRLARGDHRRAEREARDRAAGAAADRRRRARRRRPGRLKRSFSRLATMPMTPGCQPSPAAKSSARRAALLRPARSPAPARAPRSRAARH